MNLQNLKWTKNVKPADGGYAYSEFKVSELFKLAWKDDEANANRPERSDLILLRQHGYVTHLVKVLDRQSEREEWQGDYNIYRIVEVLWAIDCSRPPVTAKADAIFGYPSLWGKTLIFRWLKRRKLVNFSKTDERGLVRYNSIKLRGRLCRNY